MGAESVEVRVAALGLVARCEREHGDERGETHRAILAAEAGSERGRPAWSRAGRSGSGRVCYATAMRVAVTGSSGFVGSFVTRALASRGHDVLAFARGESGGLDLGDLAGLAERLRGVDAVVHAAGTASADASERVLGWLEVAGTENVARAARAAGVRRFVVVSSTDANLGTTARANATEVLTAVPPSSRFGRIAKAKEEALIGLGSKSFEPVVLRAGFVYGPGERTRAPGYVREASAHGGIRLVGRPLAFVPTTNVENLAHAAALAIEAPRAAHGVYHVLDRELSTQVAFFGRYSIALELGLPRRGSSLFVERLRTRFGVGLDEGELMRRGASGTLDARRARDELGYEPVTSLEEGMIALGDWVRSIGGSDALVDLARPVPDDASIVSIVRAAG